MKLSNLIETGEKPAKAADKLAVLKAGCKAIGVTLTVPKVLTHEEVLEAIEEAVTAWNAGGRYTEPYPSIDSTVHTTAKNFLDVMDVPRKPHHGKHPLAKEYEDAIRHVASLTKHVEYVRFANAAAGRITRLMHATNDKNEDAAFTARMAMKGLGAKPMR